MFRWLVLMVGILVAVGCEGRGSDEDGAAAEGGGGAHSASSSVSSSSSSGGGAGGEVGGGGAGGEGGAPVCGSAVLEPWICSSTYPDQLRAYDPVATRGTLFGPAPGEFPGGAAAGRVDVKEGDVVAIHFGFGDAGLPAVLRAAVWQEPVCGIPATPASELPFQDVDAGSVTEDPDGLSRLPLPAPVALSPTAGETWLAVALTGADVTAGTLPSLADDHEPRFAWYGLVDKDCDGTNDRGADGALVIGPEDIRTPSASGVDEANVDLVVGAELAP